MRRTGAAFFLGDTAFLSDSKFRKLARRLTDPDDFNSAVGAYWIALAVARRNGRREIDLDTETGSRFLEDLQAVGLLEVDGFCAVPFEAWAPKSPQVVAGQARAASGKRDEKGRLLPAYASGTSALDTLEELVQPSLPIPSLQINSTEEESPRGETADDLWQLYRALTKAVTIKPAALDWLDRIETTYGLAPAAKVLREEHARDGNPGTLLSRVNGILEAAARKTELNGHANQQSKARFDRMIARRLEEYRFTGKWREEWGEQPATLPELVR